MNDKLTTCNNCGGPVDRPDFGGYCEACSAGAEASTRTGLRIWSACTTEGAARRYAALWAKGGNSFNVILAPAVSPERPWVVVAATDADALGRFPGGND